MITLRPLAPGDAAAYRELRLLGLRESPTAFSSSHAQEAARDLAFFQTRLEGTPERWVLGAHADGVLIGVVGFLRDTGDKVRHKGFIVGMYVHPTWRGRVVGRQLMEEALRRIDALPGLRSVRLGVTAGNVSAEQLYASLGFVPYGDEPEALQIDGVYFAERHLVRQVRAPCKVGAGDER
ncbi:MAG: GNAT family N-acetyltransferase [Opitutales bacterium]